MCNAHENYFKNTPASQSSSRHRCYSSFFFISPLRLRCECLTLPPPETQRLGITRNADYVTLAGNPSNSVLLTSSVSCYKVISSINNWSVGRLLVVSCHLQREKMSLGVNGLERLPPTSCRKRVLISATLVFPVC